MEQRLGETEGEQGLPDRSCPSAPPADRECPFSTAPPVCAARPLVLYTREESEKLWDLLAC